MRSAWLAVENFGRELFASFLPRYTSAPRKESATNNYWQLVTGKVPDGISSPIRLHPEDLQPDSFTGFKGWRHAHIN